MEKHVWVPKLIWPGGFFCKFGELVAFLKSRQNTLIFKKEDNIQKDHYKMLLEKGQAAHTALYY